MTGAHPGDRVGSLPDLADALRHTLAGLPAGELQTAARVLQQNYRAGAVPTEPLLRTAVSAAAYAAYRMPATHAATGAALMQVRSVAADWAPQTCLDLGGGTGAALWAAARWLPTLQQVMVIDQSDAALRLGRELARSAAAPVIRSAAWTRRDLAPPPTLPAADLITMSYVLAELSSAAQAALVAAATSAASTVLVVEPGTPAGYERVLLARARLIAAGFRVLAPCPHSARCPLSEDDAWCHFATRLPRSQLHRQVKGAALAYEDEKFSYVAAIRDHAPRGLERVISHPHQRKGMVEFELCTVNDGIRRVTVSRRSGPIYSSARRLRWGDSWAVTDQ